MTRMKRGPLVFIGLLVLVAAFAVWRLRESQGGAGSTPQTTGSAKDGHEAVKPTPPGIPEVPSEPAPAPAEVAAAPTFVPAPLPAPNPPSPRRQSPAAPPLPADQRPAVAIPEPAQAAVEALALNLREYRNRFGGNPVGTNAEIVREMDGGNAKGAAYLPADLKRLNGQGELIDEWGTPYFFHQESATEMEIRSAGADRVMWTTDDIVAR